MRASRRSPSADRATLAVRRAASARRVLEDSFGTLIVAAVFLLAVLVVLAQTVRIVPQAQAGIVERLGR
jgi:hypothetical protein